MPVGITPEHEALRDSARRWVADRCPPAVARRAYEQPGERPEIWADLAAQGWLGLHLSEEDGGHGYGVTEVAVVLAELGYGVVPGPALPNILASWLIARHGADDLRARTLPALAAGTLTAAVATAGQLEAAGSEVSGSIRPVIGAADADIVLAAAVFGDTETWIVLDGDSVELELIESVDQARPLSSLRADGARVADGAVLDRLDGTAVREAAAVLFAAEAAGVARWCLDTAVDYAKVREQFGRPIGQFQAVKHRCADMLLAVEQAEAAAWDAARSIDDAAARPLTAGIAAVLAIDAAYTCAKDCIQILGGIGFTWEHDAHLYLRRATAVRQLHEGLGGWRRRVAELALGGTDRRLTVDLPEEAERYRAEVAEFAAAIADVDPEEQRRRLVESGYLVAHLPKPWGREAGPVEQLVIDEQFQAAGVRRPSLVIGGWVVPTLIAHGTREQQERWIEPTLLGEIAWCQLFSEPGAGSDLAALQTKATKVDGGWLLSGQKVWTSLAHNADWAITLARSDPDVPKHAGITYFIVDMRADGVEIRPLRELTGAEMFNEVFLSDVFVPDDNVVGEPGAGWKIARTTLANERVAMSSGSSFGGGLASLLEEMRGADAADDPVIRYRLGRMLADGQSVSLLSLRQTLRAVSGAESGSAAVRKLIGVEVEQRVSELALELHGREGAVVAGPAGGRVFAFLANRCLTIAGGTSEVQRNVIAERLLGLPRD